MPSDYFFKDLFQSFSAVFSKKLRARSIWAIETGPHAGEMWVYCGRSAGEFNFLSIPVMENRKLQKDIFNNGVENKAVTFLEVLPRLVHKISKKQYKYNEKASNNRRK